MDNISPLAKTLAESNGIDWRHIQGTGAGGQIVEEDIINYLTRVMSGDEEPPATPVDLPPPDWNGDELPPGMTADMLSQAGVESDIAAAVAQGVFKPEMPAQAAAQPADIQSDEFELELEDDAPEFAPQAPAASAPAYEQPAYGQPAYGQSQPAYEQPGFSASAEPAPAAAVTPADVTPASQPGTGSGLGGLLSQLYHTDAPATAQSEPAADNVQSSSTQADYGQSGFGQSSFGQSSFGQSSSSSSFGQAPASATLGATAADSDLSADEFDLPATDMQTAAPTLPDTGFEPVPSASPVGGAGSMAADLGAQTSGTQTGYEAPASAQPAFADAQPASFSPAPAEMTESTPTAMPEAAPAPAEYAAAQATITEQPAVAAPAAAASLQDASVQQAQGERPERAVWFGVLLRRDADLTAASDLREQLNTALGQDVPLSLLVARAAQQNIGQLGLQSVAIQDVYAHRARSIGGQGAGMRDALMALDRDHDGQPDLVIVNAGTFDLDELHYPDMLTLSLGRVQDGRASLSLNGDVDTERAADFLAAVARSLEAPVALII